VDERDKLLRTLEQLLTLPAVDTSSMLNQASQLLSEAMQADKIDIFLYDPEQETLVAIGISDTPMGAHQREVGLDRLPLANGGREAEVYTSGEPYCSGNADLDTGVLPGFRYELGVRSMVIVPLDVGGERQGVIQVASARGEAFADKDVTFVEAVAHWIGMIVHRTQLAERVTQAAAEQVRRATADELITTLAHDLNNLLTPIQGRAAMIRRRATSEGRQHDLADIELLTGGLRRLQELVEDLLDVERLEYGLFTLAAQELDMAELVRTTVAALGTQDTPIEVTTRAVPPLTVLGDPRRLRQALENLLANGQKHSPKGVAVGVAVETTQTEAGRWATVTVRDRGPGVPPELVPRLFARFVTGPQSNGLGLGLFMARSIAEVHGGTLTYDGTDQAGTSFRLAVPLIAGAPPNQEDGSNGSHPPEDRSGVPRRSRRAEPTSRPGLSRKGQPS
jgi:signal transduction histidine kinase